MFTGQNWFSAMAMVFGRVLHGKNASPRVCVEKSTNHCISRKKQPGRLFFSDAIKRRIDSYFRVFISGNKVILDTWHKELEPLTGTVYWPKGTGHSGHSRLIMCGENWEKNSFICLLICLDHTTEITAFILSFNVHSFIQSSIFSSKRGRLLSNRGVRSSSYWVEAEKRNIWSNRDFQTWQGLFVCLFLPGFHTLEQPVRTSQAPFAADIGHVSSTLGTWNI